MSDVLSSSQPLDILAVALGTFGDVHPFVGVGRALRQRGHRVEVISNPLFRERIEAAGLPVVGVGDADEFLELIDDPRMWQPLYAAEILGKGLILPYMPQVFEAIRERMTERTVVLAPITAFGAKVAAEALGVKLVTLALQPVLFRSLEDSPGLPFIPNAEALKPLARLLRRGVYWTVDALLFDRVLRKPVNEFRARFGLEPRRLLVEEWAFSEDRVIGLFPEWLGMPQPDWPPQTRLTGFPLFDEASGELPREIEQFLAAGEPPVVLTPGTGNRHAKEFFAKGVAACEKIGKRAMLLTHFADQVPGSLPAGARHFEYAPFSAVFPRAAAVVYHGGVGTAGQALAAGAPHVVIPSSYDQPDNAKRLERLGVGRTIWPWLFTSGSLARALRELIESQEAARACRELKSRLEGQETLRRTCELIEREGEAKAPAGSRRPGSGPGL